MKLFISGWAGFKEAISDIPEDWDFINPFYDYDEEEILKLLRDKSGQTVVGWSTGGHIILKNLNFFCEHFNKIVIVAGFKKFTNYVHPKILRAMIKKIKIDPETVVKDFLINAGCKPLFPRNIKKHKLIEGLEFLIDSEIKEVKNRNLNTERLILIQGKSDKILPYKALFDLNSIFRDAKIFLVEGSHFISFEHLAML